MLKGGKRRVFECGGQEGHINSHNREGDRPSRLKNEKTKGLALTRQQRGGKTRKKRGENRECGKTNLSVHLLTRGREGQRGCKRKKILFERRFEFETRKEKEGCNKENFGKDHVAVTPKLREQVKHDESAR